MRIYEHLAKLAMDFIHCAKTYGKENFFFNI